MLLREDITVIISSYNIYNINLNTIIKGPCEWMLAREDIDVNASDTHGNTALYYTITRGYDDLSVLFQIAIIMYIDTF